MEEVFSVCANDEAWEVDVAAVPEMVLLPTLPGDETTEPDEVRD